MTKNTQTKLNSVRPPKIRILYEVETEGAMVKKELPFIVAIISQLKGDNNDRVEYKERSFIDIDKDNFNNIVAYLNPKLKYGVKNVLTDSDEKISVDLNFKSMSDFDIKNVVKQIPDLKKIFDNIELLKELGVIIDTNSDICASVVQALADKDKRSEIMEKISNMKLQLNEHNEDESSNN